MRYCSNKLKIIITICVLKFEIPNGDQNRAYTIFLYHVMFFFFFLKTINLSKLLHIIVIERQNIWRAKRNGMSNNSWLRQENLKKDDLTYFPRIKKSNHPQANETMGERRAFWRGGWNSTWHELHKINPFWECGGFLLCKVLDHCSHPHLHPLHPSTPLCLCYLPFSYLTRHSINSIKSERLLQHRWSENSFYGKIM